MQRSWWGPALHTSCIAHFNIQWRSWARAPPSLPSIHRAVDFISQGAGRSFGPYNLSAPRKGLPVLVQQWTKDHPLPLTLKDLSNPEVYGNWNFILSHPNQEQQHVFWQQLPDSTLDVGDSQCTTLWSRKGLEHLPRCGTKSACGGSSGRTP